MRGTNRISPFGGITAAGFIVKTEIALVTSLYWRMVNSLGEGRMFKNREEAGRRLAERLSRYRGQDTVVLAIPRGGVVVGFEVAKALGASLDIIVPRKIGAPHNPELAIGAVAQDGSMMLDTELVAYLGVSAGYVREEAERQIREIGRRMELYRGKKPYPKLEGRTVIIVDDGIATGATMRAAVASVRKQRPAKLIVAIPVGPPDRVDSLRGEVDEVVCLSTPESFLAVGEFYQDFSQTEDETVIRLLRIMEG